ncbi:MAG TPA: hypothetical protein VFQ61_22130 [Polyangiaceae bacterium]|nr:hypothetical protein [Polyangiaceae bacterium]
MAFEKHSRADAKTLVQRWLIGLAFSASSLALLATSPPEPSSYYSGERRLESIPIELDASHPTTAFEIEVNQLAAFPDGQWPRSISVRVQAVFGAEAEARWVLASIARLEPPDPKPTQEAVLTRFEHSFEAPFAGQCNDPPSATSPCRTRFRIEFAREESGAAEGTVYGQLEIRLSERVASNNSASETIELPISVQVTES